jgi:hypothetical protein
MKINGVVTEIRRDGEDNALACPFLDCSHRYARRSGFNRHVKNDHANEPSTPSNGKRSFSSSLEDLSDSARKKTKLAIEKLRSVVRSKLPFRLFNSLLT